MSSLESKSRRSRNCPFEIGDPVYTPSGAVAFVVSINFMYREATVQWPGRVGRADFRWSKLYKTDI